MPSLHSLPIAKHLLLILALVTILVAVLGSGVKTSFHVYSEPRYAVRILSYDPLLIHLEGFLSIAEREHLLHLGYV